MLSLLLPHPPQERGYTVREGRALVPTTVGRVLTAFLARYFPHIVDTAFTSDLEGQLDLVSSEDGEGEGGRGEGREGRRGEGRGGTGTECGGDGSMWL
jgi:hypothetical protein